MSTSENASIVRTLFDLFSHSPRFSPSPSLPPSSLPPLFIPLHQRHHFFFLPQPLRRRAHLATHLHIADNKPKQKQFSRNSPGNFFFRKI